MAGEKQITHWLLKFLPGRDEWHVNSHSIGQNQSHGSNFQGLKIH